jgi:anti-sigma-K factor RskA
VNALRSDRLDELQADQALFGLSAKEQRELDLLLEQIMPDDVHSLERTAAAVDLALGIERFAPLPTTLRTRVLTDAASWFAQEPTARVPARAPTQRSVSTLAWWLAAAAAVLALAGWWPKLLREPGPERARLDLLASAGATRIEWSSTELVPGAGGDVVWSQTEQHGYMRFAGMPANDPSVQQYQLWIFDADQEHPVDGGVFDVDADGVAVVPIDAKLRVSNPTLFAVTLEKPGGVVVSDQERIALVAQI